jgi:hypothetical protein
MKKSVLIIGNHPLSGDLMRQYRQRGDEVVCQRGYDQMSLALLTADEVCILADSRKDAFEADNEAMAVLERVATGVPATHGGQRLLCHLLLRSPSLLHMVRQEGFCETVEQHLEVWPFTMEDLWGRQVALSLDREPMTAQTEKTVHLVVFGMTPQTESLIINTALVCHYPNYLQKDHSLRTRITVVDEQVEEKSQEWLQRYPALFDNSYYRYVHPQDKPAVVRTCPPIHRDREDFVDVEWEFVAASPDDVLVRTKLCRWAASSSQLLTVVMAGTDAARNLQDALHVPEEVVARHVPIYVYMPSDAAFRQLRHTGVAALLRPFGMEDRGYDVRLPLVDMAKTVNYLYSQCLVTQSDDGSWKMEYAVEVDDEERERLWEGLSFVKRMSSCYHAMTVGVKMRMLGLADDDWDQFYDLSSEEIEMLSQVEHNRWSAAALILGWRPCTDSEQREVEADISKKEVLKQQMVHYDLRAYHDLRPDATGKPVQIYDRCLSACLPLIAKVSKRR